MKATHGGFFPWLRVVFFGERTGRLAEQLQRTHWLSYLLVLTQSTAVVLVLGHAEIPLILTGSWAMRTVVGMALAILVATVYAADTALLATLRRIPILVRNRAAFTLWEHVLFVLFVLLVEGSTYAVVMSVLDRDPAALLSSAPLIPQTGALFFAQVVLRAVLICWATVQLFIVRGKLPPQLSTLLATGKEIVGGHVEHLLATLDLRGASLADSFRLYAAMSRTPRRARTWWNHWLVRVEEHQEAEEDRQTELVLTALETFEQNRQALAAITDRHLSAPREGAGVIEHTEVVPAQQHDSAATRARDSGTPERDGVPPDHGPTSPGSSASKRPQRRKASKRPPRADVLRIVPDTTAEERIRAALADDPVLSIRALAKRARVSSATASKYARLVRSEAQQAVVAAVGRNESAAQ